MLVNALHRIYGSYAWPRKFPVRLNALGCLEPIQADARDDSGC